MKQAVVGTRGGARISAESIMASGHVNPAAHMAAPTLPCISLANSEPSKHGALNRSVGRPLKLR